MSTVSMMIDNASCHYQAREMVVTATQVLLDTTEPMASIRLANEALAVSIAVVMRQRETQISFHDLPDKSMGNKILSDADEQQEDAVRMNKRISRWMGAEGPERVNNIMRRGHLDVVGNGALLQMIRKYLATEHIAVASYHELVRQRLDH